jgi:hypothetical protein
MINAPNKAAPASEIRAGDRPPKPPGEPPRERIIRIPPDKIRPPDQGPPKPPEGPEIKIPPERIKTPEDEIKIPPPGIVPDIVPPPGPADRARGADD